MPADNRTHYCGHLAFGPKDGLLYVCVGFTQNNRLGERHRPLGTAAQDLTRPHGKIIRLELGPGEPGRSLPGRPAVAGTGIVRAEFWAYGLRNPWRFAFDRETGDVLIPDVGRYHWEELNYRPAVENGLLNYGWPLAEGNACALRCGGSDLVWPIYQHPSRDLNQDPDRDHAPSSEGRSTGVGTTRPGRGLCFRRLLQRRGLGSARFRKQARATGWPTPI